MRRIRPKQNEGRSSRLPPSGQHMLAETPPHSAIPTPRAMGEPIPSVDAESDDGGGLHISLAAPIVSFLKSAGEFPELSSDLRSLASELSSVKGNPVPYRSLRSIWGAIPPPDRPRLADLFAGASFVFRSPKPREKSEELKERLRKLEELAERKAYRELVKDVAPKEDSAEPFSSYKDQIGFGLHVILIMATGYMVGFLAFRALFNRSAAMNAVGGICGLVFGMLLEAVLFIIRSSSRDSSLSRRKLKKH